MECLAGSQLAELLSGSASADLAARVDAHIDRCADCRQLLVHLARVISGAPASRPPFAAQTDGLLPDLRAERQPLASAELINRRYRILNLLGEGGMGRVYRVYDRLLSRELALKQVLFPLLSEDSLAPTSVTARLAAAVREPSQHIGQPAAESTLRSRTGAPPLAHLKVLTEEFRMLASLHHPHVVRVFDYGCDRQGHPFFTMELLPTAQPLLQFARSRSIAEQTALLVQLLDALAYLHRRGIVHRDLTPNNVLVTPSPTGPVVKLVDFGLAVDVERGTTLSVAGTFLYMAPELFQGERPSELSDLYAVGMLAYQMFTGSYPFPLNLGNATLVQRILTTAPDLSRLPAAVQPVLGAALAKDPRSRQTDVVSLRRELGAAAGLELKTEPVATRDSYLLAARFVGRHAELSVLRTALATARQGEGSAWLICGESGVGKSRFLEELRIEALHAGLLVMRGQAIPGGDAYHVFREVLRLLALQLPLDEVEAGVLCSLLPDLPALLESPLSTPHPLDTSGARLRLFHVVDAILSRLPQTTLVLLEDLQWADAASLALLGHLASSASKRTLLIITTCRDEERPPPLPPLQKLRLSRMNRQEVQELCSSMLGRSPLPQPLLDLVARETEGNSKPSNIIFIAIKHLTAGPPPACHRVRASQHRHASAGRRQPGCAARTHPLLLQGERVQARTSRAG
jgi:serine/threonine protein kinase